MAVFTPFFRVDFSAFIFGSFPAVSVTLIEAELWVDLFILLTICLLGGVVILLEKKSSGIRQIVTGLFLIAGGLIVYFCDKDKALMSADDLKNYGGDIDPGTGFIIWMFGACILVLSGVTILVFDHLAKDR